MKTQESQSSITPRVSQEPSNGGTAQLVDNRTATIDQRKLQKTMNASTSKESAFLQPKENKTGLPDNLKSGIENLSGYSMDDVKVHYNSSKPAQLQAHAYAQGTDIHLAPGQQKHLPHEAWHVVQQKQGRVKPTRQLKSKVNINDDAGLEKEADVMGTKALQMKKIVLSNKPNIQAKQSGSINKKVIVQGKFVGDLETLMYPGIKKLMEKSHIVEFPWSKYNELKKSTTEYDSKALVAHLNGGTGSIGDTSSEQMEEKVNLTSTEAETIIETASLLKVETAASGDTSIKQKEKAQHKHIDLTMLQDKAEIVDDNSYKVARRIAEGGNLSNTKLFEPITGSGVNKQVYRVKGTPWFVLVLSKFRKPNLIEEVRKLKAMNGVLPVADVGPDIDVNELVFPVKMPSSNGFKKLAQDPNSVLGSRDMIEGYGFLEQEIPGVGIEKEGSHAFGDKDIEDFLTKVRTLIKGAPEQRQIELLKKAIENLETIRAYVHKSKTGIPDFQVRYNENTGEIIVMDPGGVDGQPPKKTQLQWIDYWIKYLTEFDPINEDAKAPKFVFK